MTWKAFSFELGKNKNEEAGKRAKIAACAEMVAGSEALLPFFNPPKMSIIHSACLWQYRRSAHLLSWVRLKIANRVIYLHVGQVFDIAIGLVICQHKTLSSVGLGMAACELGRLRFGGRGQVGSRHYSRESET